MNVLSISFTLTNKSDKPVCAVLLGAATKLSSELNGRVLTDDAFGAETGDAVIEVSGVENGYSLKKMQEFVGAYGATVSQIKVLCDSHIQATSNFMQKRYAILPPDEIHNIPTVPSLGTGEDLHKVLHNLQVPFKTAPDTALLMLLQPNTPVSVEMVVTLNPVSTNSAL